MYVCFVKHQPGGKEFLFDCTELKDSIWPGCSVVCDTAHGRAAGHTTTIPILIDGDVGALVRATGAYLPLKKVVSAKAKELCLTEQDRERIAKEWLSEKIGDLPF